MRTVTTPDHHLHRLARRQHGLLTSAQAAAAGLTTRQRDHRVRTGRWLHLARTVYAVAGAPRTFHQRALAACLAAGPGAAASHRTAAHLLGLSPFARPPDDIEVVVPLAHSARTPLATIHRTTYLPPADIATVARIPVTRPARTLVDVSRHASCATLEEAVDDAVIRGLVTLDRLRARRGSRPLAAVLATWTDDMPDSLAEMRLVRRLLAAGVPQPTLQHEIWHQRTLVARLDLAWPHAKVGYELDSRRWHSSPAAHQRDMLRHNRLRALGWTVFQAGPAQLKDDGRALAVPVLARLAEVGVRSCA
jgi:hypothetical protein